MSEPEKQPPPVPGGEHTPGRWESSGWRVCAISDSGDVKVICDTATTKRSRNAENAATARLIAAAPAMLAELRACLAACKAWLTYFDRLDEDSEPDDPLRALRHQQHGKRIVMLRTRVAAIEALLAQIGGGQ